MKKKITRILFWAAGIFILLFMISIAILYFNRERLQTVVIGEINKQLAVPVDVSDVDISMKKFPSASFLFKNVYSQGAHSSPGDTLIYAERLYLQFDIWKILTSDISINKISMEKGKLNIVRRENGENNYEIWKKDSSSSSGVFQLEEVNLSDVKSSVFEGNIDLSTKFYIDNLTFSGKFDASEFWFENSGRIRLENLYFEDKNYITQATLKTSFVLDNKNDIISVTNGNMELDGVPCTFELRFDEATKLTASMNGVDLSDLQYVVAKQEWYVNKDISADGKGSAVLKAAFSKEREPEITVDFQVSDARLSGYNEAEITNVTCTGLYEQSSGKSNISIYNFKGNGQSGAIEGALSIKNIDDPYVIFDLKSDLDISEWLVLFPIDTITDPGGRAVVDIHFENKFSSLKKLRATELKRAKARGKLIIEKASFRFKGAGKKVERINGELSFSGNDLNVERLFFNTGKSDIYLDGVFSNVLNFILIEEQTLKVDCRVKSQDIDLQDFIASSEKGAGDSYSLSFARSLDLNLILEVDRFIFDRFRAKDISGGLVIRDGIINVNKLKLSADQGIYTGDFRIDTRSADKYLLTAKLDAREISVHDLFTSFNNFSQDAVKAENIYGTATASVTMSAEMTPAMMVLPHTVNMNSELEIKNGRLKNYEPMNALSRFAEISELQDVQFKSLKNSISIHDSRVTIPEMEISSSVLNLQIEGVHGFDNRIDYTMRLKLGDVLFNKRKSTASHSEFDEHIVEKQYEDDPYIYIRMHGTPSGPVIELDKKSLGKSISEDLKEQGKELKEIFRKKDSKKDKEDPGIIFEWPEE